MLRYYRWIIAGLAAILVASWMFLYYLYNENREPRKQTQEALTKKIIAQRMIPSGKRIEPTDISEIEVPLHSPYGAIKQPSIIGKYAKEAIYPTQIITQDMLQNNPLSKKREKKPQKKSSTPSQHIQGVALPINTFQNPNIPLFKGDHIDIVAINSKNKIPKAIYVAIDIEILGFINHQKIFPSNMIPSKKGTLLPQYILLDLKPKSLLNVMQKSYKSLELNNRRIYTLFQKGSAHLWIVPSGDKKEYKDLFSKVKTIKKRKKSEKISIYYEK